jgi:hypothetical protein
VSWEVIAVDTYLCPHCRTELRARPHGRQGWLRCAVCSRPSLPPERAVFRQPGRAGGDRARPNGAPPATTSPEQSAAQLADQPVGTRTGAFSPARLVFITGSALSGFMALFAFLDNRTTNMAIFGFLAIVFFVLLVRTARRRPDST